MNIASQISFVFTGMNYQGFIVVVGLLGGAIGIALDRRRPLVSFSDVYENRFRLRMATSDPARIHRWCEISGTAITTAKSLLWSMTA
jgi:hypothetical protein